MTSSAIHCAERRPLPRFYPILFLLLPCLLAYDPSAPRPLPALHSTIDAILSSPCRPAADPNLLTHELQVAEEEHAKDVSRARRRHPIDWSEPVENGGDALPCAPAGSFGPHVLSYPTTNLPHANSDLVLRTSAPLLSSAECDALLDAAERTGSARGWASRYTLQSTQTEVHLDDLPAETQAWVLRDAVPRLCRTVSARMFTDADGHCSVPPESLAIYDALVIKYDPSVGKSHLVAHADFGLVSCTIQLNDGFEGGGTWYQCLEGPAGAGSGGTVGAGTGQRTGKGHATMHAGPLWHAGAHTTGRAPRYILTLFLLSDRFPDANRRLQNRVINALRVANLYGEGSAAPNKRKVGRAAEAATALLGCALHLHPLDAESYADLVPAYRKLGRLDLAAEAGRTACSVDMLHDAQNFGTWFQYGESLVALAEEAGAKGRRTSILTEAIATYREVVRLHRVQPAAATGGGSFLSSALSGLGGALRRRALTDEDTVEAG
eukprot:CAMPEP_0194289544 /NCGR_PEP_ID=MMETSP0169-20130528/39270_1 /TAXON_ID=218684 /ORGANISM="Corethron pennatum, Strain L29A3" /LENGTH=492 /DNA_ID=CAMNT_0039036849 /DNA_START=91 /DNA_END=1565 /DNA_ORIENTATION=+